jgi:hypothetical protein
MSKNIIKTFKLNYDGTFDEIAYANIKDVFTIVNILAIYISNQKKMYIWIGKNATQALKKHVAQIRVLLKEEFPHFRIMRNITFDMRSEPFEFFETLNITKEELYAQIDHQEKIVLPIIEKIDLLKNKLENLIKSENFEEAITILKDIIFLAEKIEDDATITEEQNRILEINQKFENKKIITKIEEEVLKTEAGYNKFIRNKNVFGAHTLVQAFIKEFEAVYDLSLIPSAKNLISKEEKRWNTERARLSTDLSRLEKGFNSAVKKMDIEKAAEIHENGLKLISPVIDEKIQEKWRGFADLLQDLKSKLVLTEKYNSLVSESIILKKEHLYKELKLKIKDLVKDFQNVDLPEYRSKLDILQKEIEYAEEFYNKTLGSIGELEKKTVIDQENKKLDDVVKNCLSLIDFAKKIDLFETVDKYQVILEETEKEIEEREEFEEEQNKLKSSLTKLEKDLTDAFKAMKLTRAREILDKGKSILDEIVDIDTKMHWGELEKAYVLNEKKKALMEEIDDFIVKSAESRNNFQFEVLKLNIDNYLTHAREMNLSEHLKKLESLQSEVNTAEESFNKKMTSILALRETVKDDQEKNLLDNALKNCEELIEIAQSIKKKEIVEDYSKRREDLLKEIEKKKIFEEKQKKLEEELNKLETDLKISLSKMEVENIGKILEKGENFLSELVNEETKKKWNTLEHKFVSAKQLLNKIDELSKQGIESLMKESFTESLSMFDQIISSLQKFEGGA